LNEDVIAYNPKADKSQSCRKTKETGAPDPMEAILQLSKTLTTEK
jgi:hypothetical protein